MAIYNIDLSDRLIMAADAVLSDADGNFDAAQAVSYLSLLSCEISLKAILERAGVPTNLIRARSHDLSLLLKDVCGCVVPRVVTGNRTVWGPATSIRAKSIQSGTWGTVGQVLDAELDGASRYPNQIRYGTEYSHFPPNVLVEAAKQTLAWGREYWDSIQLPAGHRDSSEGGDRYHHPSAAQ